MKLLTIKKLVCVSIVCSLLFIALGLFTHSAGSVVAQSLGGMPDPGTAGSFVPIVEDYYDLCEGTTLPETCFEHDDVPFGQEMRASVVRPSNLPLGAPFPLIVLLHGNHAVCHNGSTTGGNWPCASPYPQRIDNYKGYSYLANVLASYGT